MMGAAVDVVIPVHSTQRPVSKAVRSVLAETQSEVRVVVVCHNIAADAIGAVLGSWQHDSRVTLIEHRDGVPSPAGPINAGLDFASAEFTALLGSDDRYERGAIDAWLMCANRTSADVVIPRLVDERGRPRRTPPVRPFRTHGLDGVRDRLAYRTVQLGLVRRRRFPHVRMTEGLRTGEDVIQGAALWFSGARISYARGAPAYVIGGESGDRTSVVPKPAEESLAFLDAVLGEPFLETLTPDQRAAFAVKLLRTHIVDVTIASMVRDDRDGVLAVGAAVKRILEAAPTATKSLSLVEHAIVDGLAAGADPRVLMAAMTMRSQFWRPSVLMTKRLRDTLRRDAPLRLLAATAFTS
jgi:glycosyltransferase involved in cell wall biosynthesis